MKWTKLVVAACLTLPVGAAPPPARDLPAVNLEGIADWSAVLPFADAIKSARHFGSAHQPWDESAPVDAAGWPTGQGDLGLVVFADQHGIDGRYPLSFSGNGSVEAMPGSIRVAGPDHQGGTTTATLTIPPSEEPQSLFLKFTGLGQRGLGNLKLMRPVKAAGSFDQRFIDLVKNFSAVRFMDWAHTNGSAVSDWKSRSKPGSMRFSGKLGVPLEVQVELANRAGVDAWFCVPHLATDDTVRRMAVLIRDSLDPARHVYVEFSNECWNGMFEQARWCLEQGRKAALSDNDFQAQLRFYSQRTVAVCRIWQEVFAEKNQQARLTRIMASQSANPWVSEQVLTWQDAYKDVDALAIAPYFGGEFGSPETADTIRRLEPKQLIARLRDESLAKSVPKMITKQAALARKFELALLGYEGGQHLAGHGGAENDDALTRLFIQTNREPGMKALYEEYRRIWDRAVADPRREKLFWFSLSSRPSKWGSWGLIESLPPDSPKWTAVTGQEPTTTPVADPGR
ncbi:hypothetical protein [Haloferula sargassicola]|uniref:Cellulose-binding domain protein n=1 Tax=Haloferula sargassicola TaxID=490096 RepID=A0ABP9UL98_9BACT